jgi:hypothetical protein
MDLLHTGHHLFKFLFVSTDFLESYLQFSLRTIHFHIFIFCYTSIRQLFQRAFSLSSIQIHSIYIGNEAMTFLFIHLQNNTFT